MVTPQNIRSLAFECFNIALVSFVLKKGVYGKLQGEVATGSKLCPETPASTLSYNNAPPIKSSSAVLTLLGALAVLSATDIRELKVTAGQDEETDVLRLLKATEVFPP